MEEHSPDTEVRIGCQPSHPFEHSIHSVEECSIADQVDTAEHVVYLLENKQLSYMPEPLLNQVPD